MKTRIPAHVLPRAVLLLIFSFATLGVRGASTNQYTVTEFPLQPGHTLLQPGDINNKGEIVFRAERNSDGHSSMFIFLPAAAYGLPEGLNLIERPDRSVEPRSINDQGQVAGAMFDTEVVPNRGMGFLWQNGVFQEFNFAAPDDRTSVRSINAAGFIAGTYEVPQPGHPFARVQRGFIRTTNDFTLVNPVNPNTNSTTVVSINNSNRVAGNYSSAFQHSARGFFWDGSFNPLGSEPIDQEFPSEAFDMNDAGEIVGYYYDEINEQSIPYLWLPAPKYGLPAGFNLILPPLTNGLGICINNSGQIVTPNHLWDRGTVTPMRELLPPEIEGFVGEVVAMNNHGQVVGFLNDLTEDTINGRTVLLSPVLTDPLTVNVGSDDDDADPNDGIVDVDLNTAGEQVSLRAAINYANSSNRPGPDTIKFDVPGGGAVNISPTNALPPISEPLTIDGSTQPGTGQIGLNGAGAGENADGLRLETTNCVIKGLVVTKFSGAGLLIDGGFGHKILASLFGTDSTGATGLGNGVGLKMANSASNAIGGLQVSTRNIFSGNTFAGVLLTNCTKIEMRSNLVGTDPNGTVSRPNGVFGLIAHKIKGFTIGAAEAVSVFNSPTAIELHDIGSDVGAEIGSSGGKLINSHIGLSSGGTTGLGGTTHGLTLNNSADFEIGGSSRNVFAAISSNAISIVNSSNINVAANYIGTSRTGNASLPVGLGILADKVKELVIGLTNRLTVINGQTGIVLRDSGGTDSTNEGNATVLNCNIGLNATGNAALGGTTTGLVIEGGSGVDIGGAARNVFAGISSNGITVLNAAKISILANHFGANRAGNGSLAMGGAIVAKKVKDLIIGMTNQVSVINGKTGVELDEVSGSGAGGFGSSIKNCFIGLNALGTGVLGTMTNGLVIGNSTGFKLGEESRNVFAGIASNAVTIINSTNINLVANYMGTTASGTTSLPVGAGIMATNARNLVIGSSNHPSVINARVGAILKRVIDSTMDNCVVGLNAAGTTALTTTNGVQIENSTGVVLGNLARNVLGGIRSNAVTILDSTNVHLAANYIGTSGSGNTSHAGLIGVIAERVKNLNLGSVTNRSIINARTAAIFRDILASGGSNTMDNCFVGLNADGIAALGAMTEGIQMENCNDFKLGGAFRNVMSGISNIAMTILSSTNVQIESGYFGTDAAGTNRVGNGGNNITVVSSSGLLVGKFDKLKSVLLSGAGKHAIEATDSPNLKIFNTAFGTDANFNNAISNLLSAVKVNSSAAFAASAGEGTTTISNSLIAFSGGPGIEFAQEPAPASLSGVHRILKNAIWRNMSHGILLGTNVSSVTIGSTNLSDANEITHNNGSGVHAQAALARVLVEINSIFTNLNKALEMKTQNSHQIIQAMRGSTRVQGNVSGQPNQTLRLHFYGHRPKAGAQGEGEIWLGTTTVPLDAGGAGVYNVTFPRTAPGGWLVSSTATDPVLGTSEFCNSQIVQPSTDTDNDGLPDFWESLYPDCLNPVVADPVDEDCDDDGFTNLQEYIAGTDPTEANSALRVLNLTIDGNGASVEFIGIVGRQYGLERQLFLGNGEWERVVTAIPEADGQVTLTDPNPPSENAFYRVVAEFP